MPTQLSTQDALEAGQHDADIESQNALSSFDEMQAKQAAEVHETLIPELSRISNSPPEAIAQALDALTVFTSQCHINKQIDRTACLKANHLLQEGLSTSNALAQIDDVNAKFQLGSHYMLSAYLPNALNAQQIKEHKRLAIYFWRQAHAAGSSEAGAALEQLGESLN